MSPKISNIIAIELAILIGIMAWMAHFLYSHLSFGERTAAEVRDNAAGRVATITPGSPSANQRPHALSYRSGREHAPSGSEEAEETAQEDYQDYRELLTEPDASSGLENNALVETSQSYAKPAEPSPVVVPAYREPVQAGVYEEPDQTVACEEPVQTVAYEEPVQAVVYQEPAQVVYYQEPAQFVVYSNPYRFVNRIPSTRRHCAFVTATPRSPDRIGPHQQHGCGPVPQQQNVSRVEPRGTVGRIEPRRNRNAPSVRANQGFRMEGIVRQASGNERLQLRN